MTQITIDSETFRVKVEGDSTRPALMLSNALGTTLETWNAQMPVLLKQFRVIRYDARGHGESTQAGPVSIARLGRDALAILDALDIDKALFVGISMGGAVGQWLLASAPERVERVVLACTSARFGTPDGWNARILAVRTEGMAAIAAATMERWFSPAFLGEAESVRRMLLAASPAGYASCCAALRDLDLRQALQGVRGDIPVLIITGTDDPVISSADTAFLLKSLGNSRHVSLSARHIANVEAGAAFTEAVLHFLTAKLAARKRTPTAARKAPARGKATRRASAARLPLAKAASTSHKAKPARKPVAKAATKKKTATKTTAGKAKGPTRRATKTVAARGVVKKPATKAKPTKTAKKAAPKTTKRPPAPRRKPAKTPRRPSGRRKT